MPANIIPVPIVQSGTGLVDFRIHNGGNAYLNEFVINVSGYLTTDGTVSPNTPVKIGQLPPDAYTGIDAMVTPNVTGIIQTNSALVQFNDPNNSGSVVSLNMAKHYIIAPTASPKVFWASPREANGAGINMALSLTSGNRNYTATATINGINFDGAGLNPFGTFPNIGVVNSFPFGDQWHPSDLPISLQFGEQVTPFGRILGSGADQLNVVAPASIKYFHSGFQAGRLAAPTSGMFADAYNDTYVFPSWDSLNLSGIGGFNTAVLNPLINYISGGGRVLLLGDAGLLLVYLSQFTNQTTPPTNLPFNFAGVFPSTSGISGAATSVQALNTQDAGTTTINLQASGKTTIARSGDAMTAQLLKPYSVNDAEAVVANFSTFRSLYVYSGVIGTGTFKFGIQENQSGYILAGHAPYGSGHIFWIGAQGGSMVTTWALNALFMAGNKWTSDTISGGYGPG